MTTPTQSAAHVAAHATEPWEICGATHIWSPIGKANVASCSEPRGQSYVGYESPRYATGGLHEAATNAKRIVACVNALAGLNPEALSDVVKALEDAAQELYDSCHSSGDPMNESNMQCDAVAYRNARKALANLKGAQ
jgi:hypothetical protein